MTEIKILTNGPLFVQGDDVTLIDADGTVIEPSRRPFALCRCGQSTNKPFCDGTHKNIEFDGTCARQTPAGGA